jgi:hypothetical protein
MTPNLYPLLTHSMEQITWEASWFSASQEIPCILWNPKVLCRIYMCGPPVFLYQFHSLFWTYHSWGIKQGLGIVTCKAGDLRVIGLVCVFTEVFFQHLIQSDLLPHLQSLFSIHASALCSWVPCWGIWEHKALVWVGYKLLRWGNNLQSGVYYSKFLDFFPVWGEHSVNHGWLCTGEDVCQVCGHRPLLHQSTMGLAQEWTPPR